MGIIILFFFIVHAALMLWLLVSMHTWYGSLLKMFSSVVLWIGFVLAIVFYVWYFYGMTKRGEEWAFDIFFTVTINFGIYPGLVGVVASFLPKAWVRVHFVEHILTSAIFFIWFFMLFYGFVISNYFDIYKYFNIPIH